MTSAASSSEGVENVRGVLRAARLRRNDQKRTRKLSTSCGMNVYGKQMNAKGGETPSATTVNINEGITVRCNITSLPRYLFCGTVTRRSVSILKSGLAKQVDCHETSTAVSA